MTEKREKMGDLEYYSNPIHAAAFKKVVSKQIEKEQEERDSKVSNLKLENYFYYMPTGVNPDWDSYFPVSDQEVGIHSVTYLRGQQGTDQQLIDFRYASLLF